ncbi:hypothetical protein [Chitiniphilus eburneus]|uniref:Bacterial transcriptional activator domain-containing protein n=1 Tax=Chitiniphilus eburneus TaxID=2571148 RepID=A0A4V5MS86_9NEIS|nr:hypothetical protein [Chitiniphilus eburneus]TJZ79188.1 hypothetical protein FAZ21_02570 [Chitiniphilus eburneus]
MSVRVELTTPQTVDGARAPFQSLWLLVRLAQARQLGHPAVHSQALHRGFSDAKTLRMAISRAFRDFARWGVTVGWGDDSGRDVRFLNTGQRSRGPFWLPAAEAARLQFTVAGVPASPDDLIAFLGEDATPMEDSERLTLDELPFWRQMTLARLAIRSGRLVSAQRDDGALGALRLAGELATVPAEQAHLWLTEAWIWRRLGDAAQTARLLQQLRRLRRRHVLVDDAYLAAMERLLGAWCAYDRRDLACAERLLDNLAADAGVLLRHHPHLRFEWHNLSALLLRSRALAQPRHPDAGTWARVALERFGTALATALRSQTLDAAQQGAANLGMAQWLFRLAGLGGDADSAAQAVQWIAFSEWLCVRNGLSRQSAWNPLYLMRIARGELAGGAPIPLDTLLGWAGPFAEALAGLPLNEGWHATAMGLLHEHDAGRCRYPATQLCALLYEAAWFGRHEKVAGTPELLARLRTQLAELSPADRDYYLAQLAEWPVEAW